MRQERCITQRSDHDQSAGQDDQRQVDLHWQQPTDKSHSKTLPERGSGHSEVTPLAGQTTPSDAESTEASPDDRTPMELRSGMTRAQRLNRVFNSDPQLMQDRGCPS